MVLSLSDGFTSLKGVEYREMPALSLLTSPGCKVIELSFNIIEKR